MHDQLGPEAGAAPSTPDAVRMNDVVTKVALSVVILWTLAMFATSFGAHDTPLYYVETDLVGEYIPAAQQVAAGSLTPEHLSYKGPGYPLMLSGVMGLTGGDGFVGARVLSVLGSGAAIWLGFRIATLWLAPGAALLALGLMLMAPNMWRYAIEAGTDAPAVALALLSTWWLLATPTRKQLFAAGVVAGLAILTRYNAAFLVPAALVVLAARKTRWGDLGAYAGGLTIPAAAWLAVLVPWMLQGFQDRNYLNIAYELYGNRMAWDQFEASVGVHFHSLWDVLRYDPVHVVWRIAGNLLSQRWLDLTQLVPWWLGLFAAPGVVIALRTRSWRPVGLHALLCALVLAPVFYNPRFALYLLPFYAACAAFMLVGLAEVLAQRTSLKRQWAAGLVVLPLIASGVASFLQVSTLLREAPHEVRVAGSSLAAIGVGEGRILARKPHVAYFSGLEYRPLPAGRSLVDLLNGAKAENADYLFYSPIERVLRPEYAVLADPDAQIPGFELIDYRGLDDQRFYAVYRLDTTNIDPVAVEQASTRALIRRAAREDLTREDRFFVAVQLVNRRQFEEALRILEHIKRDGVNDPVVEATLSTALLGVGNLPGSYAACRRAMALTKPTAWHHERLGTIREQQGQMREAKAHFSAALRIEPGNPEHLERLGIVEVKLHDYASAAASFERCVRLDPNQARYRRLAMGAYDRLGDRGRMEMIFKEGLRVGIPPVEMLGTDIP